MILTEGIETALAIRTARPDVPVWAAIAAGHLAECRLPEDIREVVIAADHDSNGAGIKSAERLAERLVAEGRRAWIAMPATPDTDFADLLVNEGADGVRETLRQAYQADSSPTSLLNSRNAANDAEARGVPLFFPDSGWNRPLLRADIGDLANLTASAWQCLLASNDPPWLFRTAARLVWIDRDDAGAPFVRPLDEDRMMHALARIGDWRRVNAKGESYQVHPPLRVVKNLLATANPAVPVLAGIVAAPIFGRDGTIETKPGYLRGSAVLFEAEAGFTVGAIPDRPMEDEVKAARSLLLDELLGDFPFTTEVERVHALSLLLLPFVRAMIEGPTPLHLIEKPTPGTGATLMVDAIATITTGRPANIMTEGRDEDEWRKRLTAKLRSMPVMLVIDNVRSKLDSSALAAALTAPSWEDRLLGRSEMIHFPIRCAWIATGNNPELSNEMARRIVRIRLDAGIDQPWRRQTFRHPDLLSWIRRERAGLVRGSLILIQNWIAKGRLLSQKRIGSFEAWSATMGGIIEAAGLGGFLDNTDELYQRSDSESEALRAFIAAWWDRFGLAPTRIGELLPLALDAEPSLPVFAASEQGQRVRLGNLLQRTRDRVFNITGRELRITRAGINQGNMRWRLTVIDLTCRTPEDIDEVSLRRSRWVSNHDDSPVKAQQYQCRGESGGSGETILYTRKDHRPPYIIIGGSTHQDPNRQLTNCFCVEISGEGALRRVTARCSVARAPPPGDRYSSDRMT